MFGPRAFKQGPNSSGQDQPVNDHGQERAPEGQPEDAPGDDDVDPENGEHVPISDLRFEDSRKKCICQAHEKNAADGTPESYLVTDGREQVGREPKHPATRKVDDYCSSKGWHGDEDGGLGKDRKIYDRRLT